MLRSQCINTDPDPIIDLDPNSKVDEKKNKGPKCGSEGNPCSPASGNKFQSEMDYVSSNRLLEVTRNYNSLQIKDGAFGYGWSGSLNPQLIFDYNAHHDLGNDCYYDCEPIDYNEITILQGTGRAEIFLLSDGQWQGDSDTKLSLEELSDSFILRNPDSSELTFSKEGRLLYRYDSLGRGLDYTYNNEGLLTHIRSLFGRIFFYQYFPSGHIKKIITPDGEIVYSYDSLSNLILVTYPDASSKTYHYENANFPHHLTGITDEKGIRFSTWTYNGEGKAISSEHSGGVEKVTFSYTVNHANDVTKTSVTGSLGDKRTYYFTLIDGVYNISSTVGDQCRTCGNGFMKTRTYDTNGFINGYTDWQGNQTTIINNVRGLPVSQTDAVGTAQERTKTTIWHSYHRLPTAIIESNTRTDLTYDGNGQLLTHSLTDLNDGETRTTTYTYDYSTINHVGTGLIASIDGSRDDLNDITLYDYNTLGNLNKITNTLGHITQITAHDASGRPLTIVDPNAVVTTLAWNLRGRLLSFNKAGSTTNFAYDPIGQLTSATQADGSYLEYEYDDAHRLISISDNENNKISYTLDKMGNRTNTSTTDSSSTIAFNQSAIFDQLSHLKQSLGSNGQQQTVNYDANHNSLNSTDALTRQTQNNYDALDRLIKNIDPDAKETDFEYDHQDNLTKVTDAKGLETTYIYNGFDEVISQISPDTGTTSYTYDKAGNRTSKTDARGVTVNYSYDALNRLTHITYADSTLDVTHTYDSGANGIGRLGSTTDASGITDYNYDSQGNLISQTRNNGTSVFTTSYSYNSARRLSGITYPNGNLLQYQRASNGDISAITATVNGMTQTIISNATYQPFGPLKAFTYGNNLNYSASFDLSGRLTAQTATSIQGNIYAYNTVDNLVSFSNSLDTTLNQSFVYDVVDRLVDADGNYGNFQYVFDVVGNRTNKTGGGHNQNYSYESANHHLESVVSEEVHSYSYDAMGNTTDDGKVQFSYGEDNRMHQVSQDTVVLANYTYNSQGQRIHKQVLANGTAPIPASVPQTSTVYDDAESGTTDAWTVFDNSPSGATITNVFDAVKNSNVIELSGSQRNNGYRLGHNNSSDTNAWSNTSEKVLSWDMKFSEHITLHIGVETTLGTRYLKYTNSNSNLGIQGSNSNYIHHGLGANVINGEWQTISRNLEADVQDYEPDNQILSVNGFQIRGSGLLDNITLQLKPVSNLYEDAENSTMADWVIYDNNPSGASVSTVFDATKNSDVLEFIGDGILNGYRLGHNLANNANALNNMNQTVVSWDSQFSDSVRIYIAVQTTQGLRYLSYADRNGDIGITGANNDWISHGLGENFSDGTWKTTTRNLEADLQAFEPNNYIKHVNGFYVRGNGRIDNLQMALPENSGTNGSDTDYIYDQQGKIISEISNNSQRDTIYFNGQPLAFIENGQVYYYHNNHLGAPETITDENQNVVWKATYTPYGEADVTTETVENNIRLPGQYLDSETGLHYNYFRYYDAGTGRYVTSDPIGLAGGINTYGYVGGNPTNFVDPLGLFEYSTGLTGQGTYINKVGGTLGLNGQQFSTGDNNAYKVIGPGVGLDKGFSLEANGALYLGEKSKAYENWSGYFNSFNIGIGSWSASYFFGSGWYGFSFGRGTKGFDASYTRELFTPFMEQCK